MKKTIYTLVLLVTTSLFFNCSDNGNKSEITKENTVRIIENSNFGKVLTDSKRFNILFLF